MKQNIIEKIITLKVIEIEQLIENMEFEEEQGVIEKARNGLKNKDLLKEITHKQMLISILSKI